MSWCFEVRRQILSRETKRHCRWWMVGECRGRVSVGRGRGRGRGRGLVIINGPLLGLLKVPSKSMFGLGCSVMVQRAAS